MDLVNIMNIGNELYSGLSSLSRQSYLLFTEVPEMIINFIIKFGYNARCHWLKECAL